MSCRWVSSWSRSSSWAGLNSATCRAISEPIDPPAPVMRTRWPARDRRTALRSVLTVVRPRRSSMRGSRAWRIGAVCSLPAADVADRGQDLHGHPGRLGRAQGPVHQLGRGVGDGQQHLLDGVAIGRGGDVLDAAHDGDADQRQPVAAAVVVEDRHRDEAGHRGAQHLADGLGSGVAAADDRHPQAHAVGAALPGEEPRAGSAGAPMAMVTKAHPTNTTRSGTRSRSDHVPQRAQGDQEDERRSRPTAGPGGPPRCRRSARCGRRGRRPSWRRGARPGRGQEQDEVLPVHGGRAVAEVGDLGHAVGGRRRPGRRGA